MRDVGTRTAGLRSSDARLQGAVPPGVSWLFWRLGAPRVISSLALFFSLLLQAGCGVNRSKDQARFRFASATDALGRTISLREYPTRIVSTAPSNTEILLALGLREKLVGVTHFYGSPEKVQGIERVGGYTNPSVEKIVSLKPDIVFAARGNPRDVIEELRRHGIIVFTLDTKTVPGLLEDIHKVAALSGTTDQATRLIAKIQKDMRAIRQTTGRLSDDKKPRVLWLAQEEPLRTAGPGSLVDELIRIAGGKNVAADEKSLWPAYSTEKLLLHDPEVVILGEDKYKNSPNAVAETLDRFRRDAIWKNISAVGNDRVHYIPTDILGQPSPTFIEGLKMLARHLHPDLFAGRIGEDK